MNPISIQQLLRVRSAEEADHVGELIPWSEREEATRQAVLVSGEPGKPFESNPISDSQWRFLAERAALLDERAKEIVGDVSLPFKTKWIGATLCFAAFAMGATSHSFGLSRSFDLVAIPILFILLWNAIIYVFLVYSYFQKSGTNAGFGLVAQLVERRISALVGDQPANKARKSYLKCVTAWLRSWATPTLVSWFHAGSACLVLGLLAAIYLRGLNIKYVAEWESTWLNAQGLSSILGFLLGPASWLSGIPLPDTLEDWSLLERVPGRGGANAGPWIHLYAITLIGWIVVPRLILSTASFLCARHSLTTPPKWDQEEPYLRRILGLARQDGDFSIAILPFDLKNPGIIREGIYRDAFERLVRETWGQGARPFWLECASYGKEEDVWENTWSDAKCDGALLLFDIHTTPEDEVHGALLDAVLKRFTGGRGGVLLVLESSQFDPRRCESRLALWQQLAWKRKVTMLPVDKGVTQDTALSPSSLICHPN